MRATTLLGATVLVAPHQTRGTRSVSPDGMKPIPLEVWDNRDVAPEAVRTAFDGPNGRGWLLRWLPARAHDNGLFVLFSNGVGRDDDEVRTGNAMIIDPYGRIVAETPVADEAVVAADLDLDLVPLSTGRRWLRGRRSELYDLLTEHQGNELSPCEVRFDTPSDPLTAPN
ncbi:nitrilase-related carbon-nitrogen hydrolase [Kribbella sp. DT2]|uniref:nitrilase-related carbon-nitrogen hydrolase n=1 Tax=Kribbella sp. DT2 TaxID=3393427 RepID=UPI003CF09D35